MICCGQLAARGDGNNEVGEEKIMPYVFDLPRIIRLAEIQCHTVKLGRTF